MHSRAWHHTYEAAASVRVHELLHKCCLFAFWCAFFHWKFNVFECAAYLYHTFSTRKVEENREKKKTKLVCSSCQLAQWRVWR